MKKIPNTFGIDVTAARFLEYGSEDELRELIAARRVQITDKTKGCSFWVKLELTDKEIEVYQRKRRNKNEHHRNERLKNRHMT